LDAELLYANIHDEGYHIHHDSNEAFIYYTQAAKQGNVEAIYKIGYMYLEGRGIKQNYIKAYKYIVKAAEKNHPDAKSLLVASIKETVKNIDYKRMLKMFEAVTLNGVASLEYNIGCFYEDGFGDHNSKTIIEENLFNALEWYHLAAKKNNLEAIQKLGMIYQNEKIYKDYDIAYHYFRKGAELNHPDSLYTLDRIHLSGRGARKNLGEAFNLFFEATRLGHSESRSVLSLLYGTKMSIDSFFDDQNVRDMMKQAGNNGNTIIQYQFGCYYESSNDIKTTIKWYKLAAKEKWLMRTIDWVNNCHKKDLYFWYIALGLYLMKTYAHLPRFLTSLYPTT
jgi:TPR repeat protein